MSPFCATSHYLRVRSLLTLHKIFEFIPNLMPYTALLWPLRVPIQFLALTSQSFINESSPAVANMLSFDVCRLIANIYAL